MIALRQLVFIEGAKLISYLDSLKQMSYLYFHKARHNLGFFHPFTDSYHYLFREILIPANHPQNQIV
jgi:hypothetical protein